MKITKEWLDDKNAGYRITNWFLAQSEADSIKVCEKLIGEGNFDDFNWFLTKLMNRINCIKYSIFIAEKMLIIHERKCGKSQESRNALDATKKVLENDTQKNRYAAATAADNICNRYFFMAGYAALSASSAKYCDPSYCAAFNAYPVLGVKILKYGLELLQEQNGGLNNGD